ncbi:MAG TPA: PspC domain-containing protein [Streptosporangiaceae bacterium]|nr:PspC domain-containing protein [Streptosporangiaceae bacterium]
MNTTTTSPADSKPGYDHRQDSRYGTPPLERATNGRMLAGVAAGAARYLGVDPTLLRILFAVLVVVGGIGIPLYLACWLLIPEEGQSQSIASELIQSFQAKSR